jgi:hypothetical protein
MNVYLVATYIVPILAIASNTTRYNIEIESDETGQRSAKRAR